VRDIFGRDSVCPHRVAELALRFCDLVRALKGQKLRTGDGLRTGFADRPAPG
jgi:hypothetical protein